MQAVEKAWYKTKINRIDHVAFTNVFYICKHKTISIKRGRMNWLNAFELMYYYVNNDFWLSIGKEPNQFPAFGGLMWGGLT